MTWRELEDALVRLLEGKPLGLELPEAPPPGVAGFYWHLIQAALGDEAALERARALAKGRAPSLRYLVEAAAHKAAPEKHPPPEPALLRAWRAYQRARLALAPEAEPEPVVLAPAASLPLAAGGEAPKVSLVLPGHATEAEVRLGGMEARPFAIIVAVPGALWPAVEAWASRSGQARVFYRTPLGESWNEPEAVELWPGERALALLFPRFWLYDLDGVPQDARVLTRVELA